MAKRFGKVSSYEDWCIPRLVSNTLDLLDCEIPRYRAKIETVQLCFTTDPFMVGYQEASDMSIAAISKLNAAGIRCTVLTKGLLPIELVEMSDDNEYGISLISLDEYYRRRTEPGAAPFVDRIRALKDLSEHGSRTWISIEPYPTPNLIQQDLLQILNAVSFVDRIIFGRTNYSKEVSSYTKHRSFYHEQGDIVIQFCKEHSIGCYVKHGTMMVKQTEDEAQVCAHKAEEPACCS
jgi:DNA repair photolyase